MFPYPTQIQSPSVSISNTLDTSVSPKTLPSADDVLTYQRNVLVPSAPSETIKISTPSSDTVQLATAGQTSSYDPMSALRIARTIQPSTSSTYDPMSAFRSAQSAGQSVDTDGGQLLLNRAQEGEDIQESSPAGQSTAQQSSGDELPAEGKQQEQKAESAETPKYLPWIAGGLAVLAAVGTVVYVTRKP